MDTPLEPATLTIDWSPIHQAAWDGDPQAYLEAGLVGWGRSRRLARCTDPARHFTAYLGIHHTDPGQWGRPEPPHASFFLSLIVRGHTLSLRTYPTLPEALAALWRFYEQLCSTAPA